MKQWLKSIYMFLCHPLIMSKITHGKRTFVGARAQFLNPSNVTFKDGVRIGSDARIFCFEKFASHTLKPELILEDGCYIGNRFTILCSDKVWIKSQVLIASDVVIASHNHGMDPESELSYGKQPLITAPVTISEGCWIGEKAMILPGVTIGKKCIIGAGSVVTKSVPDYCMAMGNPAVVKKIYSFETKKWENV